MDENVEVWGFATEDVEAVRRHVEVALGVLFAVYESASIGPYLFAESEELHAELTLRPNADPSFDEESDDPDDAFVEPEHEAFGTLLYVEWRRAPRELAPLLGPDALLLEVE